MAINRTSSHIYLTRILVAERQTQKIGKKSEFICFPVDKTLNLCNFFAIFNLMMTRRIGKSWFRSKNEFPGKKFRFYIQCSMLEPEARDVDGK